MHVGEGKGIRTPVSEMSAWWVLTNCPAGLSSTRNPACRLYLEAGLASRPLTPRDRRADVGVHRLGFSLGVIDLTILCPLAATGVRSPRFERGTRRSTAACSGQTELRAVAAIASGGEAVGVGGAYPTEWQRPRGRLASVRPYASNVRDRLLSATTCWSEVANTLLGRRTSNQSSGSRIRTCDLRVMSPVPSSRLDHPAGSFRRIELRFGIRAVCYNSYVPRVASRSACCTTPKW